MAVRHKYWDLLFFLIVASAALFFLNLTSGWPFVQQLSVWGTLLVIFAVLVFYIKSEKDPLWGSSFFFFTLFCFLPIAFVLTKVQPLHYPGFLFLSFVFAWIWLLHKNKKIKQANQWWQFGTISRTVWVLIAVVMVMSAGGLLFWVHLLKPDLTPFITKYIPNISLPLLLLAGLGFALTNALVEEFFFRGFLQDGLQKAGLPRVVVILIPAVLFALLHWQGFPGGWVGMGLVFVWGLFLGVIRDISKGMLGPYLAHLFADITIFTILLVIAGRV